MKRLLIVFLILFAAHSAFAASGCTVASSVADRYSDTIGEHVVVKITVTQTGTTFNFTEADLSNTVQKVWKGYVYWIGIDPTGTLDAAPQLTITDRWNFTQFSDTSSFHVANPIKVLGNSYDGQYVHLLPGQVWSFNDVGASEVLTMYVDIVR
jgi:hypothetical protein